MLTDFALVAVGGALGAVARVLVAEGVAGRFGVGSVPGILVVNVSGSTLLGLLAPFVSADGPAGGEALAPLLATGALGGYTTVSTFSLQTLGLLREGALREACVNVAASVGLCLAGAATGLSLGLALLDAIARPGAGG